jgi:hypothetical protein
MKLFDKMKSSFAKKPKSEKEKKSEKRLAGFSLIFVGVLLGAFSYFKFKNTLLSLGIGAAFSLGGLLLLLLSADKKKVKEETSEKTDLADFLRRLYSYLLSGEAFLEAYFKAASEIRGSGFKDSLLASFSESGNKESKSKAKASKVVHQSEAFKQFEEAEVQEIGAYINACLKSAKPKKEEISRLLKKISEYLEGQREKDSFSSSDIGLDLCFLAFLAYFIYMEMVAI